VGATASTAALALVGIVIAGLGIAICAPTLIAMAGRATTPDRRGSAVSVVTTVAYLGFLVGPAAVGLVANAASLRAALGGVALVAVALALLAAGRARAGARALLTRGHGG
jgi:MFS family permease